MDDNIPDYQLIFEAFPIKYNSIITGDPLNFPVFWETRNLIVNYIDQRNYPRDITQPTAVMVRCGQFFNETVIMIVVDDYALEFPGINAGKIAQVRVFETGRKFVKALPPEYVLSLQMQALSQMEDMFADNEFTRIIIEDANAHAILCKTLGYRLVKTRGGKLMWMKTIGRNL